MASVSFLLVDQMFHVLKLSPDHSVCADDELRPWVPLVVGDIVVSLKPDPLLTFSQETVIARLPLTILHHCRERDILLLQSQNWKQCHSFINFKPLSIYKSGETGVHTNSRWTHSVHGTWPESPDHPHDSSRTLKYPEPRRVGSLWWGVPCKIQQCNFTLSAYMYSVGSFSKNMMTNMSADLSQDKEFIWSRKNIYGIFL